MTRMWRWLTLTLGMAVFVTLGHAFSVHSADIVLTPSISDAQREQWHERVEELAVRSPLLPLPPRPALDQRKVHLGGRLFTDPGLSFDGTVACSSCHPLNNWGMDGLPKSIGIGGRRGDLNAPTIFNASLNFAQFWNGRAESLEDQIDGPILNPSEMGTTWPVVLAYLKSQESYRIDFEQIYGPITVAAVKDAIATFEAYLTTPDAPFDRYLMGDEDALSATQKEGYRLFEAYGCVSCHQGRGVGGNMYEKMGVFHRYDDQDKPFSQAATGRFAITRINEHRYEFKVPSLRNVAMTAPYFHDGSAPTLDDAIEQMAYYQLGRTLDTTEIRAIAAFLASLSGQPPNLDFLE